MSQRWMSIGLAVVLAGGCSRTESKPKVDKEPAPHAGAPTITIDDGTLWKRVVPAHVTRLHITAPGAAPVVLAMTDDGWRLEQPVQDRADLRAVAFALNELRQLEWDDKPVTEVASEYDAYKIGPADAVSVRITEDGVERPALVLGKKKSARVGEQRAVYRIHNLSYFTFNRELRFWRDRTVTRIAPDQVTRLELREGKDVVVLERTPPPPPEPGAASGAGTWKVVKGGKVDLARAEHVYRRLLDLEGADIASVDAAAAGLETPRLTLAAHTAAGDTRLEVGGATADGGVYVRVDGGDRILTLSKSTAAAVAAPLAAWRDTSGGGR